MIGDVWPTPILRGLADNPGLLRGLAADFVEFDELPSHRQALAIDSAVRGVLAEAPSQELQELAFSWWSGGRSEEETVQVESSLGGRSTLEAYARSGIVHFSEDRKTVRFGRAPVQAWLAAQHLLTLSRKKQLPLISSESSRERWRPVFVVGYGLADDRDAFMKGLAPQKDPAIVAYLTGLVVANEPPERFREILDQLRARGGAKPEATAPAGQLDQPDDKPDAAADVEQHPPGAERVFVEGAAAALRDGRLEEALEGYRNAARINPKEPQHHRDLGMILGRLGRGRRGEGFSQPGAEHLETEFRRRTPRPGIGADGIRRFRGGAFGPPTGERAEPGDRGLSLRCGDGIQAAGADRPGGFAASGGCRSRSDVCGGFSRAWARVSGTGLGAEAVGELRRAVNLAPDLAEYRHDLGVALSAAGRFDEAGREFEHEMRLDPNNGQSFARFGEMELELGRLDGARDAFDRALAIEPHTGAHHRSLALVFRAEGDLWKAIRELEEALRLDPDRARWQGRPRGAAASSRAASRSPRQVH